jgi:D-alanine transaminase
MNDHPPALASVNGKVMPLLEARIPALDRGFLFGDAVYEVLRVYGGRMWLADEHFARLARSLGAVGISGVDLDRLGGRLEAVIAAGPFLEATAYIQITRGSAPRAHKFPITAEPLEFFYVDEFTDPYSDARRTGIGVVTAPDLRWERCDIKSTNLLANVLAMQAASQAGCTEAILYLPDGTLTEGTHTSFFGVREDTVLTAPNSAAILPGITRGLIMRLAARAGIAVREHVVRRGDVTALAELFLTGTTSEVMPIIRADGRDVGNGQPGPITRRLQEAYQDAVAEFRRQGQKTRA